MLLSDRDLNSPIAITLQMINAVTQNLTDQILSRMQPSDVLIKPDLGDISSGSFDRSKDAIPLGEAAAQEMVQKLRRSNVSEGEYAAWQARLGIDLGFEPNRNSRWFIGLARGSDSAELQVGSPTQFVDLDGQAGSMRLGYTNDTLNQANFPSSGMRVDLRSELYRTGFNSESNTEVIRGNADWAFSYGRHRLLLGMRGSTFYGAADFRATSGFLGGFLNLSGFSERELLNSNALLGRALYYRRMTEDNRLFSVPAYIGFSFESGGVYARRQDVNAQSLIFGGSVFAGIDTFFGPIFLGYGRNDTGSQSWYLTFGSLLRPSF